MVANWEDRVKYILSWGGGVNSTAIIAMHLLGKLPYPKEDLHIVFADTGVEYPTTYEYVNVVGNKLNQLGYKVKVLRAWVDGELYTNSIRENKLDTLLKFYQHHHAIPWRLGRACTDQYKITPIRNYCKSLGEETITLMGIDIGEKHRARELGSKTVHYPLISEHVDREGCIKLIADAGLPPADKSGCYFCAFQAKPQWLRLYREHPELFKICEDLENDRNSHDESREKIYLRYDKPIREVVENWLKKEKENCKQAELFEQYRHCFCEL